MRSELRRKIKKSCWIILPILLAVGGFYSLGHPYEAVETLVKGDERPLRDELRPIRDRERVIIFALDGDENSGAMEVYRELDEEAVDALLESVEEEGVPDLQVVYFPGIDLFTHVASSALSEQQTYLAKVLDRQINRILEVWREAGVLEDTYLVFTADHGHTPVLNDDRHSLGVDEKDEPTQVLEDLGFRMRPYKVELDEEPTFQATVAYSLPGIPVLRFS